MKRLKHYLCIALLSILAGAVTGVILIPVAYSERGYFAVGGEWVLIIAAAVLAARAINKFYQWQKANAKNPRIDVGIWERVKR